MSKDQVFLEQISSIKGWLSKDEASLLVYISKKVYSDHPMPHVIVEIGSFHGKSTILFGNVAKEYSGQAKIYAVDPHEGWVSTSDKQSIRLESSLSSFKDNVKNFGLERIIELIQKHSFDVQWTKPINLLFIDGLHDYENTSRDFMHFATFVIPGGYIAFHDYAVYFPGVMSFVNEILESSQYKKIAYSDTLIVIEKLY